jgi:hypothetical protein
VPRSFWRTRQYAEAEAHSVMSGRDERSWLKEPGASMDDLDNEWDALEALRFAREDTAVPPPAVEPGAPDSARAAEPARGAEGARSSESVRAPSSRAPDSVRPPPSRVPDSARRVAVRAPDPSSRPETRAVAAVPSEKRERILPAAARVREARAPASVPPRAPEAKVSPPSIAQRAAAELPGVALPAPLTEPAPPLRAADLRAAGVASTADGARAEDVRASLVTVPPSVGSLLPPIPFQPVPSASSSVDAIIVASTLAEARIPRAARVPGLGSLLARTTAPGSRASLAVLVISVVAALPSGLWVGRGLALPPHPGAMTAMGAAGDSLGPAGLRASVTAPSAGNPAAPGAGAATNAATASPAEAEGGPSLAPATGESADSPSVTRPTKSVGHARRRPPAKTAAPAPPGADHKT